jgi:nifR3 family TIM-barrel protein
MTPVEHFDQLLAGSAPVLALAPMQDVTDLEFWELMSRYGGPDLYFTEYFRVHPTSNLEKKILRSVTENPTGKPAVAQMIGNDIPSLVRTAKELQQHNIAAVDLNLGCPAPVVYNKCAGGGLLREPDRVDRILGALREAVTVRFTVKTRIGFDDPGVFEKLLPIFAKHSLDLLTVHGRTVKEMYRSAVHYDYIARAVEAMECPVIANGNVYSAEQGQAVLNKTNARGLMIGRGAIRNPWLFEQIRQRLGGEPIRVPSGRDALSYIRDLYESVKGDHYNERGHVMHMKKYMNYFGVGVDPDGGFLHAVRRVTTEKAFFELCERFLDHGEPMPLEPFDLKLGVRDVVAGVMR